MALVAFCCFEIGAVEVKDNRKLNCMVKWLKEENMLQSDFPNFPNGVPENCDGILATFSEASYREVIERKGLDELETCVTTYLSRHKYAEIEMKHAVISASSSRTPKIHIAMDRQENEHMVITKAVGVCHLRKSLGMTFDNIMNAPHDKTIEDENPIPFICARKHVSESGEVDLKVYHVKINPKNIDLSKVNCTEVYQIYVATVKMQIDIALKGRLSHFAHLRTCFEEKLFKMRYIDSVLILEVLSELNLTEDQKAKEKKKFLDHLDNIFESIFDCM